MPRQSKIYVQIVEVTYAYLGPAADRFIARQVQNHLQKEPADLDQSDVDTLINWIKVAISFITEDSVVIDEYISRLETIATNPNKRAKHGAR